MLVGINGFLGEDTIAPIKEAGFSLYRYGIQWTEIQKDAKATFDWEVADRIVDYCKRADLLWMPILFGPLGTSWPLQKWPSLQTDMSGLIHISAWVKFVQEFIERYSSHIYMVEIWQAVTCGYSGWKEPRHSVRQYVEFFHNMQDIIGEVDASMRIMPASSDPEINLAYYGDLFGNNLFNGEVDALGVQFYYNNEECASRIFNALHFGTRELRRMLLEFEPENGTSLIMTETGWPVNEELSPETRTPGEEIARYPSLNYADGVQLLDIYGQCHRIERVLYHARLLEYEAVFIHTIKDNVRPGESNNIWGDHCGLLDADLNPRPAYVAVKDFIAALKKENG